MPHGKFKAESSNSLINVLRQTNVGNAGRVVAQQMYMRIEDGRVDSFTVLAQHWVNEMEKGEV
jgi:hypothetical protein